MQETTTNTDTVYLDDDALFPDGWDEHTDIFTLGVPEDNLIPQSVDAQAAEDAPAGDAVGQAQEAGSDAGNSDQADAAPTTGTEQDAGTAETGGPSDAGEGQAETAPEDGMVPAGPPSARILNLKVNHENIPFDVTNTSDEDLAAMIQKAYAYDAKTQVEQKAAYRAAYQEQIEAGMSPAVAAMVAANAAGGNTYPLTDDAPDAGTDSADGTANQAAPQNAAAGRDFASELAQVQTLFPDFTTMPPEVLAAYQKGADLMTAVSAYQVRQARAEAEALRRENNTLKQNAAAAAKAPVKGVTSGGAVKERGKTEFERNFEKGLDAPW